MSAFTPTALEISASEHSFCLFEVRTKAERRKYPVVVPVADIPACRLHGKQWAALFAASPCMLAALKLALPMLEEAQEALCERDDICIVEGEDGMQIAIEAVRDAIGATAP